MAIELGTGYVSLTASAKGIGNSIASEIGAPLSKAGEAAGATASRGFVSKFKGGLGALKTVAIGAFAGVAAGVGVGVALEKIGSSFDEANDKIRIGTGATGDTLKGLEGTFKTVFTSVPTSMGAASDAVTTLNQKLGLTGKPLEALSTQFINLSRLTGTDLTTNIASVTGLFNQFGVSAADQPKKLDELFRVSQKTGVSVGDLSDQMAQSGPVFKEAGFSFESSASLLGLLGKSGLSVSDVLPAISKSLAVAAKAGKPAQQVFADTFAAIKGAPNDTKAAGIALDVFGAKAGPKFAALIRGGQLSYEQFAAAIAAGGDTINTAAKDTDDWQEKLQILKNKALVAIAPIAAKVFDGLTVGIEKVSAELPRLGQFVKTAFQFMSDGFHGAEGDGEGFFAFMENVGIAARTVVDAFKRNWPQIKAIAGDVLQGLQTALGGVVTGLKAFGKFASENKQAVAAFVGVLAGMLILNQIAKAILAVNLALDANPFVLLAVAIAAVVAGIVYAYFHFQRFRDIVDSVVDFVVKFKLVFIGLAAVILGPVAVLAALAAAVVYAYNRFVIFRNIVQTAFAVIQSIVTVVIGSITLQISIFVAVATALWRTFGSAITTVVTTVFSFIGAYISAALQVVRGIILVVTSLIHGDWGKAWDGIKQILAGVWNGMKAIVSLSVGVIKGAIQAAWAAVKAATNTAWTAVKTAVSTGISTVVTTVAGLPGKAVSALASLGSKLVGVVAAAWDSVWTAINTGIGSAVNLIAGFPGRAVAAIGDLSGKLVQKGKDLIAGLVNGVVGAAKGAAGKIAGAIASAIPGAGIVKKVAGFIPGLAAGGVVLARAGGTLVRIGEGGQDEAVIPLSKTSPTVKALGTLGSAPVAPASMVVFTGPVYGASKNELTRVINEALTTSQRNGVPLTFKAA